VLCEVKYALDQKKREKLNKIVNNRAENESCKYAGSSQSGMT